MAPCRVLAYCYLILNLIEAYNSSVHVPEFMKQLYEENARNNQWKNQEIIRSFTANVIDYAFKDSGMWNDSVSVHFLSFQMKSLPRNEVLTTAQLRLHTLFYRHHHKYNGALVKIYLVKYEANSFDFVYQMADSKLVSSGQRRGNWETFDVTEAVRWWQTTKRGSQILRVTIEPVFTTGNNVIDFSLTPKSPLEPLLLVYTADPSSKTRTTPRNAKRDKRQIDVEELEEETNNVWDIPVPAPLSQSVATPRKKKGKNSGCRRRPLYVDFKTIHYDSWIIAPRGYEAYECVGRCLFPLGDHVTPTKHAIVQSLLHAAKPETTGRPCCVPTRLEPISLLYVDDQGMVTYKYNYEDMVVVECGCR